MYTGERILPRKIFNVTYQQSLVAYEFAQVIGAGRAVLDVACGEGYGSSLLAEAAGTVVGLDYDARTVRDAQRQYQHPGLTYVQGNLFDLPQAAGGDQFDVVCCFQTIEHVRDHDRFLQALISATKPGGTIIFSTPNRNMFPSFNPYHVHEVDHAELQSLLKRHFTNFKVLGVFGDQDVWNYRSTKQKIGSAVLKFDVLQAREHLPEEWIKFIYRFVSHDIIKRLSWLRHKQDVTNITTHNFTLKDTDLARALDFIAVARRDEL